MAGAEAAQFFTVRHPANQRAHEVPLFRLDLPGLEQVRIPQQHQASGGLVLVYVPGVPADEGRADHQGPRVVFPRVKLGRELVVLGFPVIILRSHQQGVWRDALLLHGRVVGIQDEGNALPFQPGAGIPEFARAVQGGRENGVNLENGAVAPVAEHHAVILWAQALFTEEPIKLFGRILLGF